LPLSREKIRIVTAESPQDHPPYFLESARLGFRPWTPADLPLALTLWGDPRVTAFIDARGRLSAEQVEERLAREMASQELHGEQYWPVFVLETGDFAGCCGLRPRKPKEGIHELGIHLRPEYWGKGFAREAALMVVQHAFDVRGTRGLFAGHHPGNEASRHLLESLGFRCTHTEYYAPTGLQHPSYFLTAGEYAARRGERL
jgi:RimJ/RimL family protein N-acetyltransferase